MKDRPPRQHSQTPWFLHNSPHYERLMHQPRFTGVRPVFGDPLLYPQGKRVPAYLRYLATGCSLAELHFTFRVGKSTASQTVREVTGEIWSVLFEKEIPPLNHDLFLEIAQVFQDSTDFPHCIGALDGKHVRLVQPENGGSLFYNYKKNVNSSVAYV
ncbi:hypothetical protein AVEN_161770-1 [Araneus ventricosus]|uniref:DDE Tnp4 domain-containing protein n=1 Tax=Araneus ventricosus TaxID=182803 RepID=A0A4Y2B2P9_ARAVE|nr:hypothetical protein AVEN_245648-1 [Araneus ventricosus]GBL86632.1 hypothetical protein AVEN_161770-1 [Araneus ventricosus]